MDQPDKLKSTDNVSQFSCGQPDLDGWLRRHALANQGAGMCTVFVARDGATVAGYYALATGGVDWAQAPERVQKGVAHHAIPVVLLARLAVATTHQSQGIGRSLLRDALLRVATAAEDVGVRALLIHAKDDAARAFYMSCAEFEASPTDPLHLFLLMKDLRKAVA